MKIGLVVPHIFMHRDILPEVIFAPGRLALDLAEQLQKEKAEVVLFTPGPVDTPVKNITSDLAQFKEELKARGDSYTDLLKKHPFTFVTLARQVQSELIAKAFEMANQNKLDVIHIFTNEEDIALPFVKFCQKPVVLTHHDPFNFLVKYKSVFPKYPQLNWVSISMTQRKTMPANTNWAGNVYNGLKENEFKPNYDPAGAYMAYLGRIIEPKGVHLAIEAVKLHNKSNKNELTLKIAGKHYSEHAKDTYWQEVILPQIDGQEIQYLGFINNQKEKQDFLGNAKALLVPSLFEEPFGMVIIESLACGTPVIGLNTGAIPEIIRDGLNGFVVKKGESASKAIAEQIAQINKIDRKVCRQVFENKFTLEHMAQGYLRIYKSLTVKQ